MRSAHGSDFAPRRPRHSLAVARNVPQSVTVPLLLPHRLFGTACRRTCSHPQCRCSCSGVGSSPERFRCSLRSKHSTWLCWAVMWPCSFATLRHVNRNSFIIMIIIMMIIIIYYCRQRYMRGYLDSIPTVIQAWQHCSLWEPTLLHPP